MTIDPEINVAQLQDKWTNGDCSDVLNALSNDHPGLTALFLLEGIRSKRLNQSDCNVIVNHLIDQRVAQLRQQEGK